MFQACGKPLDSLAMCFLATIPWAMARLEHNLRRIGVIRVVPERVRGGQGWYLVLSRDRRATPRSHAVISLKQDGRQCLG